MELKMGDIEQSRSCKLRRSIRLSYCVFYRRAFVKAQMFLSAGATLLILPCRFSPTMKTV
jgi:hypothetical protein